MFPVYPVGERPPLDPIGEEGADCWEEEEEAEEAEAEDIESRRQRLKAEAKYLWEELKSWLVEVSTVKNILNAVFVLMVSGICLHQCYSQINDYLKYETRLQVLHTYPDNVLWLIPGVTICSNNRLRMSKLTELMPSLKERLSKAVNKTDPENIILLPERKRLDVMRTIKLEVDGELDTPNLINKLPISKLIEYSRYPMIKDVNCNNLWGKPFNCENFYIIESYQGGYCNTLFYGGAILRAIENGIAFSFNSILLAGAKRKIDAFEYNEVAEIIVEFEPLEHGDFQRDVGGKLVIHSSDHIGSIRDMAHSMTPGNSYSIVLKRTVNKRLPPPYQSMCFDYRRKNLNQIKLKDKRKVAYASTELDQTTCVRNCVVKQTTKDCGCWPVEVPYFEGDIMINGSESLSLCSWAAENKNENLSAAFYVDCYKRFHTICRTECKTACKIEDYRAHVMPNAWPTRGMFFQADTEAKRKQLFKLKGTSVRISLKYLEFLEDVHVMSPNITVAQLVSNLGGIISALIGVSLITVYRYLTINILHCKVVSDYNPYKRSSPRRNNRTKARIVFSRAKTKLDIKSMMPKRSNNN